MMNSKNDLSQVENIDALLSVPSKFTQNGFLDY